MLQLDERARVKARIKALTEKTVSNGCTEAEAMSAAEMVGKLLARYALTMEEIDIRAQPCTRLEIPIGGQQRRPIDTCVTALARFCECRVWVSQAEDGKCYVFFGFETDIAMAGYLFSLVDRAIASAAMAFRLHNPRLRGAELRQYSRSFQLGMAERIGERLNALHAARAAEINQARGSTGTALTLAKQNVVEDAFREMNIRLHAQRSTNRISSLHAYRSGQAAGDRVNLQRPVGDGAQLLIA